MPTTEGSTIIDLSFSLCKCLLNTIIASSAVRVFTNNRVTSVSTNYNANVHATQIENMLFVLKKLTMIPIVCILCSCFEKVDDSILYNFYNFSDISFQLISTKRSLARYSSKTKDEKFTNKLIETQNYTSI